MFCVTLNDRSYRDKRTSDFASGTRVKAFSRIERFDRLKPDRLASATMLKDLAALPGNRFEALVGSQESLTANAPSQRHRSKTGPLLRDQR